MSTVILAEKPSQALAYASALKQSTKKDGYFEIKDPLFTDETFITFGFGHLVELAEPGHYDEKWQNWKLESLPIFPDRYDFEVAKDKGKQFKIVAELLKKANTIIVATDSDREGENIAWSIIHKANAFSKDKTFKRLWINSLEKDVIRSGFQNLQPGMNYYPFYQEAQTRQIADWLIGMNASPLYTLNLQQKGVQGTFSLGRVQTPTLYLIFQRQEAIENFKKEPFFEVEASIKVNQGSFKGVLSPTQRFKTQEELLAFVSSKQAKIGNQEGIIADVQTKEKKTNSPSLFSLSSLQSKVNQLYKATASQTLKAMQGLYEAKLLSYPRTDTPFITENEFAYLKANFGKYSGFLGLDLEMVQTEPRKRYVDGSKVQEHHAIIPTKQVPTESALAKMDDLQRKIYALVVKTTVAMFLPDYLYEETKIQTKVADLLFQSIGKTPKQEGWKILFKQQTKEEKEDVQTLPLVIIGERAEVGVKSVEKETQPPKAFTEGTLLTAMKTANKTVDDEEAIKILQEVEGIGTEATRASIIEALKQKEYIQVIKNKLVVTEKGKLLCQAVESQHLLTSAEMTAKWETYLKKIGKREGNQENFINNIKKFIVHLLENVPTDIEKLNFSDYQEQKEKEAEKNIVGKCPKCGKEHWTQDPDTLDTWFSSALWPFSTLGWPEKTEDLDYFYPNDVLVTGYDIIFFWVIRMIFSGYEQMGKAPFHTVLFHGLVRDSQGRKMSKSLGNGIDPLEVIDKYGADALRLTLITGNAPGNDMRFYWERVEASRNFANKVWNASRFIMMNLEGVELREPKLDELHAADKWILSRVNTLAKDATENMDKFELGIAVQKVYDFIWDEFCDWYIEIAKVRTYKKDENPESANAALWTLKTVLVNALKLLHPYMPFITEEIFCTLQSDEETIMLSKWPEYKEEWNFPAEEAAI